MPSVLLQWTIQEVITPFTSFYMDQPLKLDYFWAGLCMIGAIYFIFRA